MEDVFGALDRHGVAQRGLEDRELHGAQVGAAARGGADRAMVLDEQEAALRLLGDGGHVAFLRPGLGERGQFGAQAAAAGEALPVRRGLLCGAVLEQPRHRVLAQGVPQAGHQPDRQVRVAVREEGGGAVGQVPALRRPADRARLLGEGDQPLGLQVVEMLAHRHGGHAQRFGQGGGVLRPVGLQQAQDAVAGAAFLAVGLHGVICKENACINQTVESPFSKGKYLESEACHVQQRQRAESGALRGGAGFGTGVRGQSRGADSPDSDVVECPRPPGA